MVRHTFGYADRVELELRQLVTVHQDIAKTMFKSMIHRGVNQIAPVEYRIVATYTKAVENKHHVL